MPIYTRQGFLTTAPTPIRGQSVWDMLAAFDEGLSVPLTTKDTWVPVYLSRVSTGTERSHLIREWSRGALTCRRFFPGARVVGFRRSDTNMWVPLLEH